MFGAARSQVKSVPSIGVPFAPIPLDVMRRKDLTPVAKLVFSAVANQARMRRGDSTWTNAQIADAVGMTASGVRRPLDELEAAGLIERRYGASERVRESIRIAYSPSEVGASTTTQVRAGESLRQPGWRPDAPRVGAPTATPYTKNEERSENALALDSREEKIELDPKPSPEEVAAALRAMTAGRYAPQMFDGTTTTAPPRSTGEPRSDATPARADRAPTTAPGKPQTPAVRSMARRVGYSAVAAIVHAKPPRKTADQQLAELRRWSADRSAPHSR